MITKTFYTVQLSNFQFPTAYYDRVDGLFHGWDYFINGDDFLDHFFDDKKKAEKVLRSSKKGSPSFIYDLVEVTVDVKVCQ